MELLILLLIFLFFAFFVNYLISRKVYNYEVKAKVTGFENIILKNSLNNISPTFTYIVDGIIYKSTMYLLSCTNTPENRELYLNKEYTLYYDKKHPNRVNLYRVKSNSIYAVLTLVTFILLVVCLLMYEK